MNRLPIFTLILALFVGGTGLLVALYGDGSHLRDAHHLIGLSIVLVVLLAITGSFKGGRRNGR